MQRFSEDEANEILTRAARQPLGGEYTLDDLRQSAGELGISEEALATAQAEVLEERLHDAFEAERRSALRASALTYALTMTLLVGINLATSPSYLWFAFPLLGWGFGVAVQALHVRNRQGEDYRQAFERFRERQTAKVLKDVAS